MVGVGEIWKAERIFFVNAYSRKGFLFYTRPARKCKKKEKKRKERKKERERKKKEQVPCLGMLNFNTE